MAFIDERGRVFGVMNVFDAAVSVGVVVTLALAGVGYRLIAVPPPPRVVEVSPNTFTEAPTLRMAIKGENLMPYMHVYVQRTGEPTKMMHDSMHWVKMDSYTPVNGAKAAFRLESPTLGEVETLDELLPGTYDLIFRNETQIVGAAQSAFTVIPAPKIDAVSRYRETIVRIVGAFVGLNANEVPTLKAAEQIPTGATSPMGEVISIGSPRPDVAKVDVGSGTVDAPIVGRSSVSAELRLRCTLARGKCYSMDQPMVVGETIKLNVGGGVREFVIQKVTPESPRQ
ncbi:MAG TPA: hypothetical protein VFA59_01200 [Vicinamibacterales bacterium]|nr:hypothetical protein [Vicinamibacterales bacterium]